MPRPAKPDSFSQINFVVNYALLGCTPPSALFVEFAKEPKNDLAALILLPDLQDIGQVIFEPKKERKRRPGRRGRKNRRRFNFPDTSDMIGTRARSILNPFDVIRLSPVRYLFPLINLYEGVTFTVALIEGFTGIFYEGLLGVITVDPFNCRELSRLKREQNSFQVAPGVGPPIWSVFLNDLVASQDFQSENAFCFLADKSYVAVFSCQVRSTSPRPGEGARAALGTSGNNIREQSSFISTEDGEWHTLDVSADFAAGETCVWGIGNRFGGHQVRNANILAYSTADFPWPW